MKTYKVYYTAHGNFASHVLVTLNPIHDLHGIKMSELGGSDMAMLRWIVFNMIKDEPMDWPMDPYEDLSINKIILHKDEGETYEGISS